MSKLRYSRNKIKSLYVWHRYAGLFAALFVIFITISGIALNHTDDLSLKKQHINSGLLLERYNIQAPASILSFETAHYTITQADGRLFIGDNTLSTENTLVGALEHDNRLIAALTDSILLIDSTNQLIETLNELDGVPKTIEQLGFNKNGHLLILAQQTLYQLNDDLTVTAVAASIENDIIWSSPTPLSEEQISSFEHRYKSNIISLETFILDIHSGRFFGQYGTLFFDFVGLVLLFLAFTGIIIWAKQRAPNRKPRD